jgi:hypothetical protein
MAAKKKMTGTADKMARKAGEAPIGDKNKILYWERRFKNTEGGAAGYGKTGRIAEKRTISPKYDAKKTYTATKSFNTSDALVKPRIVKKAAAKKVARPRPKM